MDKLGKGTEKEKKKEGNRHVCKDKNVKKENYLVRPILERREKLKLQNTIQLTALGRRRIMWPEKWKRC